MANLKSTNSAQWQTTKVFARETILKKVEILFLEIRKQSYLSKDLKTSDSALSFYFNVSTLDLDAGREGMTETLPSVSEGPAPNLISLLNRNNYFLNPHWFFMSDLGCWIPAPELLFSLTQPLSPHRQFFSGTSSQTAESWRLFHLWP